ncbi:unnamed protein product, partial [Penicillium nalgiovense]
MQWNQNDTAAIKQGQPETSTVSLTVSRYMAGGTSTRSSWLSQPVILQGLSSLLGVPMTNIPFRAQNLILQAIQRHLESDAFQFVQKWLLEESLMVGWTCPEELELHRLFKFLVEHRDKIRCSSCRQALSLHKNGKDWFLASATLLFAVYRSSWKIDSQSQSASNAVKTELQAPSFFAKTAPRRSEKRFLLLPKHSQKVLHQIEAMYNLEVEWFL